MAPRISWKGYLKLSLVSCPVALFPAAAIAEKVSFHMLNGGTGNRLKQQYVDAETGEVVEKEDRVKGYEVAKDDYVVVSDEELAQVRIESSHNVDVEKFVRRAAIDPIYHEGHYYMVPDDQVGLEAFALIRDAMARRGVVGVARAVLSGKERTLMLEARGQGILATTLRYAYEVRDDAAYFDEISTARPSRETLEMASRIIDAKMGEFDPEEYNDRYQEAVVELIRSKGVAPKARKAKDAKGAPRRKDVTLVEALSKSLSPPKRGSAAKKPASPAGSKAKARLPVGRPVKARSMPAATASRGSGGARGKSGGARAKPEMSRR